jgi:hypothetical protein
MATSEEALLDPALIKRRVERRDDMNTLKFPLAVNPDVRLFVARR